MKDLETISKMDSFERLNDVTFEGFSAAERRRLSSTGSLCGSGGRYQSPAQAAASAMKANTLGRAGTLHQVCSIVFLPFMTL